MIASKDLPDSMTTNEAAALLGASVRTIQLWVEDGCLKAWKTPGGHRRVLRSSVEEMLRSRQRSVDNAASPLEVLVVDDDPILLKVVEKTLARLGPEIHLSQSTDGYEALIRIGEHRPDLLVTDLMMPGLDGFRLLKTLHRDARTRNMQLIVLTAMSEEEVEAQGGLPCGAILLQKPVQSNALVALVTAFMRVHGLAGAAA